MRKKKSDKSQKDAAYEMSEEHRARLQGFYLSSTAGDEEFIRQGGSIYYAVDSNVVILLCDPSSNASDHLSRRDNDVFLPGITSVFEDDPKEQISVLSHALADYIAEELSPGIPLIVPPTHDRELFEWQRRLRDTIAGRLDSSLHDKFAKWKDKATDLRDQLNKITTLDEKAELVPLQLTQLALLRQAPQSLSRLRDLIERKRIAIAATDTTMLPEPLRTVLTREDSPSKRNWVGELVRERGWVQTLAALLARTEDDRQAVGMARAFGAVERWNEQLSRHRSSSFSNSAVKVVFLTTRTGLFDALSDVVATRRVVTGFVLDNATFLLRHVRHPRGYLPLIPMLKNSSVEAEERRGTQPVSRSSDAHFLDLWTRWHSGATQAQQKEITNFIKDSWRSFIKAAALKFRPSQHYFDSSEEWQKLSLEELAEWQNRLQKEIDERASKYWESCFYFATQGMVAFGRASHTRRNPRHGPPIFMSSWGNTAKFIDKLMAWSGPDQFNYDEYREGLETLEGELRREDKFAGESKFRYAYYLAHAALFAGRGEWQIAAKVSAHARTAVTSGEFTQGSANGREAYYLEAFSLRHAARRVEDLDGLEKLILRAKLISSRERVGDNSSDDNDCIPIRFDTELLALDISRALFKRYLPSTEDEPAVELDLDIPKAAKLNLGMLDNMIGRERERLNGNALDVKNRRLETLIKVYLRLNINILTLPFDFPSCDISTSDRRVSRQNIEETRKIIIDLWPKWGERPFSNFVEFIILCSSAVVGSTSEERDIARKKILEAWADEALREIATFPYEKGQGGRLFSIRTLALVNGGHKPS